MRLVRNLVLQILKERFYNVQLSIFVHCHPRTQSSQRLESQQLFLFVRCHPRKLGSQRLESQAPAPVSVPVSRALLSKGPAGSCNAFPLNMQIDWRQICTRRVWLKERCAAFVPSRWYWTLQIYARSVAAEHESATVYFEWQCTQ